MKEQEEQVLIVVAAKRLEAVEAERDRLERALREIEDWDAGWNLDYAQHFRNLQGIASDALKVSAAPSPEPPTMPNPADYIRGRGPENANGPAEARAAGSQSTSEPGGSAPNPISQERAWELLARCRTEREARVRAWEHAQLLLEQANADAVNAASQARDAGLTGAEIASALGISRKRLYDLAKSSHRSDSDGS